VSHRHNQHRPEQLTQRAQQAALPFTLLEQLEIPCGYERSFKISPGKLFANRYLLGISRADTTPEILKEICTGLKMPESLLAQFEENLSGANLVFLGFEENQENTSYRVYLEYWDKICGEIEQAPKKTHPRLMFLGYKWDIEHPQRQAISEYTCYPLLSTSKIVERITGLYETAKDGCTVGCVRNIIDRAAEQAGDGNFIYLEVSETGNRRSSFDLNLYKSGLRIDDIDDILIDLQRRYKIKEPPFSRLLQLVGPKRLGHISGGTTGEGEEFVTCYYEN
jgi:hypothetical protein